MLEQVLECYSGIKLHKNHLLIISIREKIVQHLIRRRQKLQILLSRKADMTRDQKRRVQEEILIALKRQTEHFRCVAAVMEKVDFPKDFWARLLHKMLEELEELNHKINI